MKFNKFMDLINLIFYFIIIIPSAIVHEYAHGWTADQLGDPTARHAGRLTLNPLAHIDLFGTIFMPIILLLFSGGSFMFAYAKPVPYNPYNLKNQKRDSALVAAAGPLSNLLVALVCAFVAKHLASGSFAFVLSIIVYANILLAIFNLVPIPPLDGSKVLYALLPASAWRWKENLERYGSIILIIFIFFFFQLLNPIIQWIYQLFLGL